MNHEKRRDYRDLALWQKARGLAAEVHCVRLKMPRHEMFGQTAQFLAFLHITRGSRSELETQLFLAQSVGYLTGQDWSAARTATIEVGRLLNAVISGRRRRQETAV